jgi:hypothetical protein
MQFEIKCIVRSCGVNSGVSIISPECTYIAQAKKLVGLRGQIDSSRWYSQVNEVHLIFIIYPPKASRLILASILIYETLSILIKYIKLSVQ